MRRSTGLLIGTLSLLGILSLACGSGDKTVAPVEIEVAAVDVSDMPSVLHYPNSKGISKTTINDATMGKGTIYVLETSDSQSLISGWYKRSLSSWKETLNTQSADNWQMMAQSPDGNEWANVVCSRNPVTSKNSLSVSWTLNPTPVHRASSDPSNDQPRAGNIKQKIANKRKGNRRN